MSDTMNVLKTEDLIAERRYFRSLQKNLTEDISIQSPFSIRHITINNPTVDTWRILFGGQGGAMSESAADAVILPFSFVSIPISGGDLIYCNRVAGTGTNQGTCRLALFDIPMTPQFANIGIASGSPSGVVTPTEFIKTVASTTVPERLASSGTYFQSALLGGLKAARTLNVGIVYLGTQAADNSQPFAINSGEWLRLVAPEGQRFDAYNFFVYVLNAGDGLAVILS